MRRGPFERHARAGTFFQRAAVGVHGLFQALGAVLPLAQGPKGIAEVVLRPGPLERPLGPRLASKTLMVL